MKKITNMVLVMENCEELELRPSDVSYVSWELFPSKLHKIGEDIYMFDIMKEFELHLTKEANHRYMSFGKMSVDTIFDRLISSDDIAQIVLTTETGDTMTVLVNEYTTRSTTLVPDTGELIYHKIAYTYEAEDTEDNSQSCVCDGVQCQIDCPGCPHSSNPDYECTPEEAKAAGCKACWFEEL